MLPTLNGRIQTRIFATLVIGGLWTLFLALWIPITGDISSIPLDEKYKALFAILLGVAVVGVVWELVYHGLQQFRWEKDWPTPLGFFTLLNEGVVLYFLCRAGALGERADALATFASFTWWFGFITTWVVVFLFVNGPMRVFNVHWRFQGGRIV